MSDRKQQLETFWKEDQSDPFIPYALALEFTREQDPASAEIWLKQCLGVDENYIPALYQLAQLLLQNGRKTESIPFLEKGIQLCQSKGEMKTLAEFRTLVPERED